MHRQRALRPAKSLFSERAFYICLLFGALGLFLYGCQDQPKESLPAIEPITRQLIAAANASTRGHAQIAVRTERIRKLPADPSSTNLFADRISIALPVEPNGLLAPSLLPTLEKRLDRIAAAHRFSRFPGASTPGLIQFEYRRSGQTTEIVEIAVPGARTAQLPPRSGGTPRLAIIVDDLGNDRTSAEALFALPTALTLSVLPQLPYSQSIAEEAHRRGFEVLLHLPIEPQSGERAGPLELQPGMDSASVERSLSKMLDTVPTAVGVNNHEGSRGTADLALMNELMPLLAQHHLFFVDSRTTAETVAYDAAVRAGVPSAWRNVFLDDVETQEAVRGQLDAAVEAARRNGYAIAIGHPHEQTLNVLEAELPKLSRRGILLVSASALCGLPNAPPVQVSRASPPPS